MLISGSQIQSCKWADQVLPPARLIGERGWLKPSPSEDAVARCYEPLNAPGACLKLMMVGYQRASAYGILMLPLQAGRDERMAQLHWGHSAPVRGALKNCMDSLMKSVRATPDFLHLTIIDSLRNFFLPQICHWNTSKKKKKTLSGSTFKQVCKAHREIPLETEASWQSNYTSKLPPPTDHTKCQLGTVPMLFIPGNCLREWQARSILGTVRTV